MILPEMSAYVKTFKDKGGAKNKNNKLMFLYINNDKLLGKYNTIWNIIEDLKHVELNALSIYNDRYIKTEIRIYSDKVYTNFRDLDVPED